MMRIINDIDLTEVDENRITNLLTEVFKDYEYPKRSYYKQRPHFRCLFERENYLIGYVGLDFRAMFIDGEVSRVLGVVDMAVDAKHRNQGIASTMLKEVEFFAHTREVDLIMLFADNPNLYLKNGFIKRNSECTILMIDEHKTYGIKTAQYPELMIKSLNGKSYKAQKVDMLGYLY